MDGARIKILSLLLSNKAHQEKKWLFPQKNRRVLASGTNGLKRKIPNPNHRLIQRKLSSKRSQALRVSVQLPKMGFMLQIITSRCYLTKSHIFQSFLKVNHQERRRCLSLKSLLKGNKSRLKKKLDFKLLKIKSYFLETMKMS